MKHTLYIVLILILLQSSCKTSKTNFDYDKLLWAADWSPDGKFIAVGGNNNQLKILSAENLTLHSSLEKLNTITKIKWHPTENLIAISRQGSVEINPGDNRSEIINLNDNSAITLDGPHVRGLGWSPNGQMLATGDGEGDLRIFSKTGHLIKEIKTDQKSITGLSWHPSSGKIVTVGSHIEIVDVPKDETLKIIPREIEILILSVEWHPSGNFFVTGDYGDNILNYPPLLIFWNADGTKIKEVDGSKAEIRNLKWSESGKQLATASDRIRIWDKDGNIIQERNLDSWLWGIDWNSNDKKIVSTSSFGKVYIMNTQLDVLKKKEQ